jgi:hypothetical protein
VCIMYVRSDNHARTEPAGQVGQGVRQQRRRRQPAERKDEEREAEGEEGQAAQQAEDLAGEGPGLDGGARGQEGVYVRALVGPLGKFLEV